VQTLFVTGTDTGVGKTHVSAALLAAARRTGIHACGFKPVASGCEADPQGRLRNTDALALQAAAGTDEPYAAINPYAFEPPLAPHIAASRAGVVIDTAILDRASESLRSRYDWLLVEGAGGWQVPLNAAGGFPDWVAARGWPVLLVVGMRLGCINHALLTAESIQRCGLRLAGWVANVLPPVQDALEDNVEALTRRLGNPPLACFAAAAEDPAAADRLLRALRPVLSSG
jgi:dethiobiotin synthetase